jgi:two-component system chemotaxis response regulator CheY
MALNILVVDDSDVIRAMIVRTLGLAQLPLGEVYHASNGREALSVLADNWIDLVLADINMPVMTGAEMIREMRAREETASVPVIVVSTEGATERIEELKREGVSAWIRKPFTPEEIRDVVGEVVATWRPSLGDADVDDVIATVLETFAFAFPEAASASELPEADGDLLCARIWFSGAASGTLSMAAPAELCVGMAANILGIDQDDPDALLRGADTLGEIVNIAAGHLATRIDADATTHLHPPTVGRMGRSEWDRSVAAIETRGYLVEKHPVLVTFGQRQDQAS